MTCSGRLLCHSVMVIILQNPTHAYIRKMKFLQKPHSLSVDIDNWIVRFCGRTSMDCVIVAERKTWFNYR